MPSAMTRCLRFWPIGDNGADDGRLVGIGGDLVDKGFVNLEDVDGKLLEIAEAGIAGAKVIHVQCELPCTLSA